MPYVSRKNIANFFIKPSLIVQNAIHAQVMFDDDNDRSSCGALNDTTILFLLVTTRGLTTVFCSSHQQVWAHAFNFTHYQMERFTHVVTSLNK